MIPSDRLDNVKYRFWERVLVTEPDECWLWTGGKIPDGYGILWVPGDASKVCLAHRIAYELVFGSFDQRLCVCHTCDNPGCVNPSHLWLGTHKDNMKDMANKGRSCWGEKHRRSHLTEHDVLEILSSSEPQVTLAKVFRVVQSAISKIKNGKNWKHITRKEMSSDAPKD